jgi:hypothetical protein
LRIHDFRQIEVDLVNRLKEEIEQFNIYIGTPHVLIESPEDSSFAVGYWRTPRGVMVIERSRDRSFHPTRAQFFDEEIINAIEQAKEQEEILILDFDDEKDLDATDEFASGEDGRDSVENAPVVDALEIARKANKGT